MVTRTLMMEVLKVMELEEIGNELLFYVYFIVLHFLAELKKIKTITSSFLEYIMSTGIKMFGATLKKQNSTV